MALSINSNLYSLVVQNNLKKTQDLLATSLQRLSTGYRINSAKDDPAGLAISARLTAQISGLDQAATNTNDAISIAQTADSALGEASTLLDSMRDLALQAANATASPADRAALQLQVNALRNQLDDIARTTSFNNLKLLDGTFTNRVFQVGANANENVSFSINAVSAAQLGNNIVNSATGAGTISEAITATGTIIGVNNNFAAQTLTITSALGTASTAAISAGSTAYSIASAVNGLTDATGVSAIASTTATLSNLTDIGTITFDLYGMNTTAAAISADIVSVSDLTPLAEAINKATASTNITASVSGGTITLTSANGYDIAIESYSNSTGGTQNIDFAGASGATQVLDEAGSDSVRTGGSVTFLSANQYTVTTSAAGTFLSAVTNASTLSTLASIDVSTQSGANSAISVIDGAIDGVNIIRGAVGAYESRFESIVSNLRSASTNLTTARGRIRDTDYASETAKFTKLQILQEVNVALLSQTNLFPQLALNLLNQS